MHSEFFIKFQEHIKLLNSYIRAIKLQFILLKNIKGSTVIRICELNQPFYLNNPFFHRSTFRHWSHQEFHLGIYTSVILNAHAHRHKKHTELIHKAGMESEIALTYPGSRPILVVLGTVGNFLTVYIMRATLLKDISSCFYMFILGIADSRK